MPARKSTLRETDLYGPVKAYLERQGYEVKGEVEDCDVVAVRPDDGDAAQPVIVELKTDLNLPLVLQGVRRQALSDLVYLAFAVRRGRAKGTVWGRKYRDVTKMCRMLGLGLMTVRFSGTKCTGVEVHLDPCEYAPRKSKPRRGMMLREFERRVGDPNLGGSTKRPIVTAYRQDALRCATYLSSDGPSRVVEVKTETGVATAQRILQSDHYGWFQRISRGTYGLTPNGQRALDLYADVVKTL